MADMRTLIEMVSTTPSRDPREIEQSVLDMLDRVLGNQALSKTERADIFEKVASTATRMAQGLRQRAKD